MMPVRGLRMAVNTGLEQLIRSLLPDSRFAFIDNRMLRNIVASYLNLESDVIKLNIAKEELKLFSVDKRVVAYTQRLKEGKDNCKEALVFKQLYEALAHKPNQLVFALDALATGNKDLALSYIEPHICAFIGLNIGTEYISKNYNLCRTEVFQIGKAVINAAKPKRRGLNDESKLNIRIPQKYLWPKVNEVIAQKEFNINYAEQITTISRIFKHVFENLGCLNSSSRAIRLLNQATKISPELTQAHYLLGESYMSEGQYPLAKAEFKKAISLISKDTSLEDRLKKGCINQTNDNIQFCQQQAIDSKRKYKQCRKAFNHLEKAIISKDVSRITHSLVEIQKNIYKFLNADLSRNEQEVLGRTIGPGCYNSLTKNKQEVMVYIEPSTKAIIDEYSKRLVEVIKFSKSLEKGRGLENFASYQLANCLKMTGNIDTAISCISTLKQPNVYLHFSLANLYELQGEYKNAEVEWKKFVGGVQEAILYNDLFKTLSLQESIPGYNQILDELIRNNPSIIRLRKYKENNPKLNKEIAISRALHDITKDYISFSNPIGIVQISEEEFDLYLRKSPGNTFAKSIGLISSMNLPECVKDEFKILLAKNAIDTLVKMQEAGTELVSRLMSQEERYNLDNISLHERVTLDKVDYHDIFEKKVIKRLDYIQKFGEEEISQLREAILFISIELDKHELYFCHGDLHLGNIINVSHNEAGAIFDKACIIDFETAGRANKFYDLAYLLEQDTLGLKYEQKRRLIDYYLGKKNELTPNTISQQYQDYDFNATFVNLRIAGIPLSKEAVYTDPEYKLRQKRHLATAKESIDRVIKRGCQRPDLLNNLRKIITAKLMQN